jgi:hypothetical protein
MKLFVFEPYNWSYCGGVIGIIAETFEDAVAFIVEKDRQRYLEEKKWIKEKWKNTEKRWRPVASRTYRKKYFAKNSTKFKGNWDQWLLTNIIDVPNETGTRIAFDNWNEG